MFCRPLKCGKKSCLLGGLYSKGVSRERLYIGGETALQSLQRLLPLTSLLIRHCEDRTQLSVDNSMLDWTCCFLQGTNRLRVGSASRGWCSTCKLSIGSPCGNATDVWQVRAQLRIRSQPF